MSTDQIIGLVVVPFVLFLLAAAGGGITALVKFTAYMTKSREAQESTATSTQEISAKLDRYMTHTNGTIQDHAERLRVVEFIVKGDGHE